MPAKRTSSRRDFLKGKSAIDAISDLVPDAPPPMSSSPAPSSPTSGRAGGQPSYLIQIGRTAMACEFQVLLNAARDARATEAALEALDLVETLEEQMSWFRESSELSRLNHNADSEAVKVEPRFFALLQQAVAMSEQTDGAFDITASPLWKLWGFHRREGKYPDDEDVQAARDTVGTRWLELDSKAETVAFRRAGTEITLGAIGKGYALDRCAELLRDHDVDNFLIHGGHSSMLARGSRSAADEPPGWVVALRHPLRQDRRLAEITLRERALGTSGSGNQFFHFAGKRYGHVIDPRTGYPADGVLSATVLAPTATQADALATAFFVMGLDDASRFCQNHPGLGALFVCPGQSSGSIEITTIGIEDADWQRLD